MLTRNLLAAAVPCFITRGRYARVSSRTCCSSPWSLPTVSSVPSPSGTWRRLTSSRWVWKPFSYTENNTKLKQTLEIITHKNWIQFFLFHPITSVTNTGVCRNSREVLIQISTPKNTLLK